MSYDTWNTQNVWNYGVEIWCNLKGRYTHIVADLNHLAPGPYEMSICNLGIMGTRFERTIALISTLITLEENS